MVDDGVNQANQCPNWNNFPEENKRGVEWLNAQVEAYRPKHKAAHQRLQIRQPNKFIRKSYIKKPLAPIASSTTTSSFHRPNKASLSFKSNNVTGKFRKENTARRQQGFPFSGEINELHTVVYEPSPNFGVEKTSRTCFSDDKMLISPGYKADMCVVEKESYQSFQRKNDILKKLVTKDVMYQRIVSEFQLIILWINVQSLPYLLLMFVTL